MLEKQEESFLWWWSKGGGDDGGGGGCLARRTSSSARDARLLCHVICLTWKDKQKRGFPSSKKGGRQQAHNIRICLVLSFSSYQYTADRGPSLSPLKLYAATASSYRRRPKGRIQSCSHPIFSTVFYTRTPLDLRYIARLEIILPTK